MNIVIGRWSANWYEVAPPLCGVVIQWSVVPFHFQQIRCNAGLWGHARWTRFPWKRVPSFAQCTIPAADNNSY